MAVRALVGFLTIVLAFSFREDGGGLVAIGQLGLAASVGSGAGVFLGGRLNKRPEALIVGAVMMAAIGCLGATLFYMQATALGATLLACTAGSMGKLGLDAVIQRDVAEDTRNSAFASSETAMQLCWVLGGAVGLIPMPPWTALMIGAIGMGVTLITETISLRRVSRNNRAARVAPATVSPTLPLG
jgi:hypothetical protein